MKQLLILLLIILPAASFAQTATTETFTLSWPAAEHWKIADEQNDAASHVVLLVHANETENVWTELANMTTQKGITVVPVEAAMKQVFDQSKKTISKPVLTVIEKDEAAEFPWVLFTIESPNYKKNSTPESKLWYILQGRENLYTNFLAVKEPSFSAEGKAKWGKFFKSGKLQ